MCQALKELLQDEWEEGKAEGKAEGVLLTLLQLVRDGLLSLSVAAERANMGEEEFMMQLAKSE